MLGQVSATGDIFLLFDDSETHRMIAFATSENLSDLSTADTFYCDGTFSYLSQYVSSDI
jgi:hypothetical protein